MPQQMLPSPEAFKKFEEAMLAKGFRKIGGTEVRSDFKRLGLVAPRGREGHEVGFLFYAKGLTAVVWTTYVDAEQEARKEDAGWVLIKEGDAPKYFSHPIHRTKGFLRRLYGWAQVARERVLKRPDCPCCGAPMSIVSGPCLKARYWECKKALSHPDHKRRNLAWDFPLSPGARKFVIGERRKRVCGRDKARARGKTPGQALLDRKKWNSIHPENQL